MVRIDRATTTRFSSPAGSSTTPRSGRGRSGRSRARRWSSPSPSGPGRSRDHPFLRQWCAASPTSGRFGDGPDTVPDVRHRSDARRFLGRATTWAGRSWETSAKSLVYDKARRRGTARRRATPRGKIRPLGEPAQRVRPRRASSRRPRRASGRISPCETSRLPAVRTEAWVRSPVDRFVLAKLESLGVTPAKGADRRALLRRATFDLTGLPPTPEELDAFLADDSPGRFETVVNRLLDSPAYGERWGQALARRRPVRRVDGQRRQRRDALRLALPELRDRRLQPRPALRPVPRRAACGRPLAASLSIETTRDGSSPPGS